MLRLTTIRTVERYLSSYGIDSEDFGSKLEREKL